MNRRELGGAIAGAGAFLVASACLAAPEAPDAPSGRSAEGGGADLLLVAYGREAAPLMAAGIGADYRQVLIDQSRGANTLRKLIYAWDTSPGDDRESYIAQVARKARIDPDAALNMRDPTVGASVLSAMAQHESGKVSQANVQAGMGLGLALSPAMQMAPGAAGAGATADSRMHVVVEAGPGTKATVKASSPDVHARVVNGVAQTSMATGGAS